jgi:hypothetical protein
MQKLSQDIDEIVEEEVERASKSKGKLFKSGLAQGGQYGGGHGGQSNNNVYGGFNSNINQGQMGYGQVNQGQNNNIRSNNNFNKNNMTSYQPGSNNNSSNNQAKNINLRPGVNTVNLNINNNSNIVSNNVPTTTSKNSYYNNNQSSTINSGNLFGVPTPNNNLSSSSNTNPLLNKTKGKTSVNQLNTYSNNPFMPNNYSNNSNQNVNFESNGERSKYEGINAYVRSCDEMILKSLSTFESVKNNFCAFVDKFRGKFIHNAQNLKEFMTEDFEFIMAEEERNKIMDERMNLLFREMMEIVNQLQSFYPQN